MKSILLLALVAVISLGVLTYQSVPSQVAGSALVVKTDVCAMYNPDGVVVAVQGASIQVATPRGNGNTSCHTTFENTTGKAIHFDYASTGNVCFAGPNMIPTINWSVKISASGKATLSCQVGAN